MLHEKVKKKLNQLEEDVAKSFEIFHGIVKRSDYSNQSLRINIIIDDVPHEKGETWEMS